jgi:fusion protein PurCD
MIFNNNNNNFQLIHKGKVRNNFSSEKPYLLIETSNRCSAFDRYICDIPGKGYYLNKMAWWWFNNTSHIIPNHMISIKENCMLVHKCVPYKVEVVVRSYMVGSTETSIWTHYKKEMENAKKENREFEGIYYCGHYIPPGYLKNDKLKEPIITPTTKGENDIPITCNDVVNMGLIPENEWEYIKEKALLLFEYGQMVAERKGLVLVDTKYEFGKSVVNEEIMIIDELHTCDSSRFWIKGKEGESLDKDIVRTWVKEVCDPYNENIPLVNNDVIVKAQNGYQKMLRYLDDLLNNNENESENKENNISKLNDIYNYLLEEYLNDKDRDIAIIITGSKSDKEKIKELSKYMDEYNLIYKIFYASAHKQPDEVKKILDKYNNKNNIYITSAGMSNALSGFVAGNTTSPVIAYPLFSDKIDMLLNMNSTLQMPSNVPSMTILYPRNVALAYKRLRLKHY